MPKTGQTAKNRRNSRYTRISLVSAGMGSTRVTFAAMVGMPTNRATETRLLPSCT